MTERVRSLKHFRPFHVGPDNLQQQRCATLSDGRRMRAASLLVVEPSLPGLSDGTVTPTPTVYAYDDDKNIDYRSA